jgi:hypothetical protein
VSFFSVVDAGSAAANTKSSNQRCNLARGGKLTVNLCGPEFASRDMIVEAIDGQHGLTMYPRALTVDQSRRMCDLWSQEDETSTKYCKAGSFLHRTDQLLLPNSTLRIVNS